MRFLKILTILLLFEEYHCKNPTPKPINATHCEYTDKRQIAGKTVAKNITFRVTFMKTYKDKPSSVATKLEVKTVMKPAIEIIKTVKCCPGYKPGPRKSCTAKCDQYCENSKCTAPNECSCNDGYQKLSPNRCIPYCENCERGRCVGPNICECYNGYHKNENGQCVPYCKESCINGMCSEPDVCTCYPGYEMDKTNQYKCNPNCTTPCIQGRCSAPDVCDCHPGYEFKNGSKTECLPICDFCESGNCTGPSKCTCWNNYEEQEIVQGTNIVKICQPKCIDDCINGICIEVDTCSCKDGYEFAEDSFNVCEPACDPPCQNGICAAPNDCSCDPGYDNIEGQCQVHCDNECIYGFCVYPNQCECMVDYKFKLNSTNVCEAFCENCTDGTCVEPHICKCLDGFSMTENNVCEKLCDPDCIFGKCVNGKCICEEGFELFNQTTFDCRRPYFEISCINGSCIDNNTTSVWEDTTETIEDFPCSPPCDNEECVETNNCEPICGINNEGCTNGTCIPPGICKCFDGFEFHPSSPFVCVLENMTSMESAPVKAIITNYISLILALVIVGLMGMTLILWLNRQNCKVNYNVDEKERKVGVDDEDYVHYIINKDDQAFA